MTTIQETANSEEPNDEVKKFFADHLSGGSKHVICVSLFDEDSGDFEGSFIFSDLEKAWEFVAEQPDNITGTTYPLVIDHPNFGIQTVQ